MNTISISGRVAQPTVRETNNGGKMLTFSLADDQYIKGETVTQWFRCALFGRRAESLQSILTKGKEVTVSGQLQFHEYTSANGTGVNNNVVLNDIYITFKKPDSNEEVSEPASQDTTQVTTDEIPF